jgi:hypothetical protein
VVGGRSQGKSSLMVRDVGILKAHGSHGEPAASLSSCKHGRLDLEFCDEKKRRYRGKKEAESNAGFYTSALVFAPKTLCRPARCFRAESSGVQFALFEHICCCLKSSKHSSELSQR